MNKWDELSTKEKKVVAALILFYTRKTDIYTYDYAFSKINDCSINKELSSSLLKELEEDPEMYEDEGIKFSRSINKISSSSSLKEFTDLTEKSDFEYEDFDQATKEKSEAGYFYTCRLCKDFTIISKIDNKEKETTALINHFLEKHRNIIGKIMKEE